MNKNERKKERENIGCHRKKPCEYECGLRCEWGDIQHDVNHQGE